jgi:hypothetical protein
MSLASSKKSDLIHWSVDFVEHLRAVHFGLIALCVILILFVLGKRDASLSKAINEAIEIEQLKDEWKAVDQLLVRSNPFGRDEDDLDSGYYLEFRSSLKSFPHKGILVQTSSASHSKADTHPWLFNYQSMNAAPRNLAEFRTLWNDLHNNATVRIVENVNVDCYAFDDSAYSFDNSDYKSPYTCNAVNMILPPPRIPLADATWSFFKDQDKSDHFHLIVEYSHPKAREFRGKLTATLTFPFATSVIPPDLLNPYFPDAASGTYETAFRELADESKGLEVINLSEMINRLKDKQGKGDQNIEVIGLKLPNEDLNRWGVLLLLSAQFYLWLHLHELNKKIDATSPGWDVAWIGMYSSLAAIITMWISVGALPITAVALLALRNPLFGDKHSYGERSLAGMIILVSIALVIATIERLQILRMIRPVEPDRKVPEILNPS